MNSPQQSSSYSEQKTPGMAIASIVMGIFSLMGGAILLFIPPILAVVFGHLARGKCMREGIQKGKEIALIGLIFGYLTIATAPVGIGLMAAMAIPAFQEVRVKSMEKAALNDLRQIASASQQYFLKTGKSSVSLDELVGDGKYIMSLNEENSYPSYIRVSDTILVADLPNGQQVTYEF